MKKTTPVTRTVLSLALSAILCSGAGHADNWTGAVDNFWSTNGNWLDGTAPTPVDPVIFDAVGSGGTNTVDINFLIDSLLYGGGGTHITDLNGTSQLTVAGSVGIGTGLGGNDATVTWTNGGKVNVGGISNLQTFDIGNYTNGNGTSSLALDGTALDAFVSSFSVGRKSSNTGGGTATGTFTVGAGSTVTIDGDVVTKPNINIGFNQDAISGSAGLGAAVGEFDATQGTVNATINEFNVGYSNGGAATGTLRWDSTTPINANAVYFGRGKGATGILDVASGASFILGSGADRIDSLRLAYDDANTGFNGTTTTANLDFTVNNPDFQAFIANDLSIGRRATSSGGGTVNGKLVLGSNSTIDLGTTATPANLYIGFNQDAISGSAGLGAAVGEFDATQGTVNATITTANIGVSSAGGAATGTMSIGTNDAVRATTVNVGTGTNVTGTFNLTDGSLASNTINIGAGAGSGAGGTFNFTGGTLAVDIFNGDLTQLGGILAPGVTATSSLTNINGDYVITNGTLDIDIGGLLVGTDFDQVDVFNIASLSSTLDVSLFNSFSPTLGDSFDILLADTVTGQFDTLLFPTLSGGLGWSIDYLLDPLGTDIVRLSVSQVPIPGAVWLFLSGLFGVVGIAARPAKSKAKS